MLPVYSTVSSSWLGAPPVQRFAFAKLTVREYPVAKLTSYVPFLCSQHLPGLCTRERVLRVRFGTR
jgi:hypothetical protein